MNFHSPGWFIRYLRFRLEQPYDLWEKIETPEDSQFALHISTDTASMDELFYRTLRQNGVLFGCPILDVEKTQKYTELKFLGTRDQVTFVNIETLFSVLLREIRLLAPNLGSYTAYLARTALRTVQFYLSSEVESKYFQMNTESLLDDKSFRQLARAFEKRFLQRVRILTKFTFDNSLQNSFAFLDIYGLIQWHRRFHNQSKNPVYFLAEIEADHAMLQQQLFLIFAGLVWHSEKELGLMLDDSEDLDTEENEHLLRFQKYKMLKRFVKTTRLPFRAKQKLLNVVRTPIELKKIKLMISEPVINIYMLEQTILLSLIDEDIDPFHIPFIKDFAKYLGIENEELQVRISSVAAFFHFYEERFDFIRGNRALFHMKENINKLITIIIGKNLDRIVNEIKRTGKLYAVLTKASNVELSVEEKRFVREQLLSIAKTIPALAIFCLPAGGMVLVILIKVLPFNILPNSFAE